MLAAAEDQINSVFYWEIAPFSFPPPNHQLLPSLSVIIPPFQQVIFIQLQAMVRFLRSIVCADRRSELCKGWNHK